MSSGTVRSMLLMTWRDLRFRAKRVIVVVIGSTLVFTLVYLISGISTRFDIEPRLSVAGMGADVWVVPEGSTGSFTPATQFDAAAADGVRGGGQVQPIVTARFSTVTAGGIRDAIIVGAALGGMVEFEVIEGRAPRARGEVIVDDFGGFAVGEEITISDRPFTVVGLTTDRTLYGGTPLMFMSLRDAQRVVFLGADLANAVLSEREPRALPDGYVAVEADAVRADAARPLEQATSSIKLITFLLWVVSAMILGGVVLLSAMERRRDFAVMKAVGARTDWLLASLMIQAIAMALAAAALASAIQAFIAPYFPMKVHVTTRDLIQLPVIAVVVAVLAGIGGMRQVARTDPAMAFTGPGG